MTNPTVIEAANAPLRTRRSSYPDIFVPRLSGREKRPLGDLFALTNFGVNLVRLPAGAMSALRHAHSRQDEFNYVLEGAPILVTDRGETPLAPGLCAGFRAGTGNAHHIVNRGAEDAVYLEVGDRSKDDHVTYPDDDMQALIGGDGQWIFLHKDGRPY
jgi:uncharacterized cupin superfamily protein